MTVQKRCDFTVADYLRFGSPMKLHLGMDFGS